MKVKLIHTLNLVCLTAIFSSSLLVDEKNKPGETVLIWRDMKTKRILFTSEDIISFDWEKQVFLLRLDATLDFLAWIPPHMYLDRKLFVEDTQGIIYEANWVSDISSKSYAGPIYKPLSPNPFFSIANGYPLQPMNKDTRFDQRLREGLEKAGVLQAIDLNKKYDELKVQRAGDTWNDVGEDMKVRVEYFENSFRIGQKARAHLFFSGGEKTRSQIDSFTIDIKFVANNGRFRSDTKVSNIPISDTNGGIYICKFAPWQSVNGSETQAEPGKGLTSLTILFQKKHGELQETVYRSIFPETCITISGTDMTEYKNSLVKK